jgi:cyclopropane-fatty-acyl-phospholipid synthase
MTWLDNILDRNILPDWLIRAGIRRLLRQRLRFEARGGVADQQEFKTALLRQLAESPIAIHTDDANNQHYQVPTPFFRHVLGKWMKYSSGYWPDNTQDLGDAEEAMLRLTCSRAEIADGQRVLDLGCGWGSMTLYLAEHYPAARITAVSNSATQQEYIRRTAAERGLANVEVIRADINEFAPDGRFDRIVSVEMFEHLRNHARLMRRIAGWLVPDGRLFVHIFAHARFAYPFEDRGPSDWMTRWFFAGGMMPSADLLLHYQACLRLCRHWRLSGIHYRKTLEGWLRNMDQRRSDILPLFEQAYGRKESQRRWARWRIFFMACSELFGFRRGQEWIVAHYLFAPGEAARNDG